METVFSDRDGIKNVIFDYGNNLMLGQVAVGRQVQWLILAKDYASDMKFIRIRGIGYMVYITTENQLVWHQVGVTERIVLNTVLSEVLEIDNINIISIDNGIYVIYRMHNISENKWELRYINPLGKRKSKALISTKEKILDYKVFNINENNLLSYRLQGDKKSLYYQIKIAEERELGVYDIACLESKDKELESLKRELDYINEDKSRLEDLLDELKKKESVEKSTIKDYENRLRLTEEKLEDYIKQYNELTKLTQEIQAEGKRWRELYYRSTGKK